MCIFIDMESEASSIVRTNFVGIVGDVRRDMEGHHYRYFVYVHFCICIYPASALRALGLLLADGAHTVGRGKTF